MAKRPRPKEFPKQSDEQVALYSDVLKAYTYVKDSSLGKACTFQHLGADLYGLAYRSHAGIVRCARARACRLTAPCVSRARAGSHVLGDAHRMPCAF